MTISHARLKKMYLPFLSRNCIRILPHGSAFHALPLLAQNLYCRWWNFQFLSEQNLPSKLVMHSWVWSSMDQAPPCSKRRLFIFSRGALLVKASSFVYMVIFQSFCSCFHAFGLFFRGPFDAHAVQYDLSFYAPARCRRRSGSYIRGMMLGSEKIEWWWDIVQPCSFNCIEKLLIQKS